MSRSFARSAGAALALALVLPSAACDDASSIDGLDLDVSEPGPFSVGYRKTMVDYPDPDGSGTRSIPMLVWYPVDAGVAARIEDPVAPRYFFYESEVAIVDAPPARPAFDEGFPVLVHSHGHAGYPEQSFPIFEWLARNGFVVIAPGHVGDMTADVASPDFEEYFASHYERAFDVREALDYLEELDDSDPLAGLSNTTRAVISGHSRGTFTVWAVLGAQVTSAFVDGACGAGDFDAAGGCPDAQKAVYAAGLADPRFVAGIPMAGSGDRDWFGGAAGMNAVTAPIFQMTGSLDDVGADDVFVQVTVPPMIWIDYAGGCHNVFGSPGSCGSSVDDYDATRTFGTYVSAFMRRHLLDDPDALVGSVLDGSHVVSPSVTFHDR